MATTCARPARPTTTGSASCSTDLGIPWEDTPGWSAGSTTTPGPPTSSTTPLLGAQSAHRRRRPLRRAVGGHRRPAAARHRVRRSAWTARPAGAGGRGGAALPRRRAARCSACRSATPPSAGCSRWSTELRRAGIAADMAVRRQEAEGRHEGRGPLRRPLRRDPRGAGYRRRRRPGQGPAPSGGAGRRPAHRHRHDVEGEGSRNDPHPRGGHAPPGARRPAGHAGRLGRPPPRPRRRHVHRPARRLGHRAGRVPRGGRRARPALRVLRQGHRRGPGPRPRATRTPSCRPARSRSPRTDIEVLSEAAPLPFPIEGDVNVNEEIRLKYRYLDMRRDERGARRMRIRSEATLLVREVMREHDFVDVETPTLTRSTPEGARDFLVPVRLQPGTLVRPAAVAAAVQAAAHGRRAGAVLPDRPLLPGRGLPGRPAARVHPARHRDVLRRPGGRPRARRGARRPDLAGARGHEIPRRSPG